MRDVTMKQSMLEADNSRLESELFSVRRDYTSLGSDRTDQEREMTQLRMKLAVVEQDLKMKDEQLIRAAEELSLERDEKVCLSLSVTVQQKPEGPLISNLVYGWSTMARITDMGGDLQAESSGYC